MIRSLLTTVLALLCVASASAQQTTPLLYGSNGNLYRGTYPDSIATTASVTTATTTQLIAALPGQRIFIYWLGAQASGANTTATFQYEYSTVANCASGNTMLTPSAQTAPTTASNFVATVGSITTAQSTGAFGMTDIPLIIPAGNNLCMVTAGGSIALYGVAVYAQHT